MSEGVERSPLIEAEPAKPVGESSSVPRSERARRTGYRRRFAIVYGALALVGAKELAAVKAGKHVMVTKPLSDSEAAARELVEAAETAEVVNMMSLSTRFSGNVQYLGQLAQQGVFGDLYYARARSVRRSGIPDWGAHFVQEGGGAMRDMGVHVLDADATGVHQLGRPAIEVHPRRDAIAGHAGGRVHDGDPPPRQPVEEAGLADVRPADNGDHG